MKTLIYLLLIALFSLPATAQNFSSPNYEIKSYQNGFLKNIGQVTDTNNKNVSSVHYTANLGNQKVFITDAGLSILFSKATKFRRVASSLQSKISLKELSSDSLLIVNYEMERIDIVLENASILLSNIATKDNLESPTFYFNLDSYNTAKEGLRLQDEVLVKNIYPGIDWKIYINHHQDKQSFFKYDFIVHPGADPSQIKLRYSRNAKLKLIDQEVVAKTIMGTIHERNPYSYIAENKSEVPVAFGIKKNTIKFFTGDYDKSKTLVIDPSIFWLTYLSSTNHVNAYQSMLGTDVETDGAGNIFVQLSAAGNIPFPAVNPGGGVYYKDFTSAPDGAMIISKFAPGGQMLWSTYFGNGVAARVMTIDRYGNLFALGMILDGTPSVPNPNPSIPLLNNGGFYDGARKKYFITKFSNSGVLLWSSYYANYGTYPTDMTYDSTGNIYVTGCSTITDFPSVDPGGGAYVSNPPKAGHAQVLFISQFNNTCNLTWSTRLEGSDYDPYARVCIDKLGNIYVGGQTRSSNYPLVNAGGYYNDTRGNVITRFNPARQMTWSTYYPAAFSLWDLTTDDSCNLYVLMGRNIVKFNSKTELVYDKSLNFPKQYVWKKIVYDAYHDQLQLLGSMNDSYFGFPAINTACNGTFFHDAISPFTFNSGTGPIFATMDHDGKFSYLSLADWVPEYYDYNEMTIDPKGDPIYLFGYNQNGYVAPNPQLTNPGNGAYFDNSCCYGSNGNLSAMLLKLTSSELSATAQVTLSTGCSCNGSVTVSTQCGQAPFKYTWSNGDNTASVSGLCPGNYWVKITDANNLTRTIQINIPNPPGGVTSLTASIIPENCNRSNGVISIQKVQGGISPYSYSLDGINFTSASQFTGLDSGEYIIRVKDVNGCQKNDTIQVSRIKGPTAILYATQKSSCISDNGQLQVTNVLGGVAPYHYTLNPGTSNNTGSFTNLVAANYQLTVTDTAGCSVSTTIAIEKAPAITNTSFSTANDHCGQGIGWIKADSVTGGTGPYLFSADSISFIQGPINNLKAGSYSLYVKDANGCVLIKTPIIISNVPGPSAVNTTIQNAVCGKLTGSINVNSVQGGSVPLSYSIDGSTYTFIKTFQGIQAGNHILNVKDSFNCIYSEPFGVLYTPIAKINLLPYDTTVCYGENVMLRITGDTNKIKSVKWSIPAQGFSSVIKPSAPEKIYVTLVDSNDCIIKDTAIIRVSACNPAEKCVVIPSAFTPNLDGKNEMIGPIANGCKVENIHFKIFNRWGEILFESKNFDAKWNGMYNGIPQPVGVYIFTCTYITDDGISRNQNGIFTMIR